MTAESLTYKNKGVKLKLLRTVGFYSNEADPLAHPFFPPLALGILFTQLKKNGYDVSQDDLSIRVHCDGFDKRVNKQFRPELFFREERIKQYNNSGVDDELEGELEKMLDGVDIEGVDIFLLSVPESPYNSSNILFTIAFSKFLKKKHSPYIVVGGDVIAVTLLATRYDVAGTIDYISIGDGEDAIVDIIDGIIYNKYNRVSRELSIIRPPPYNRIVVPDFSGLPFEKYRLSFLDYRDFCSDELLRDFFASDTSMLLFRFTKGCPNTCAFCAASEGRLEAVFRPAEVVGALATLQQRFHPTGYLFMNDTVNISRVYLKQICELIRKRGIHILWSACARVNGLDDEIVAEMREAGCVRLILGMETASSKLLKSVNKGITIPELERVLELTYKYGIWTGIEVICGLPHETEEDVQATIDFLQNNQRYIDTAFLNVFDLREHSLMFVRPQDYGIENIRELNIYRGQGSDGFNITNFVRFGFDETNGLRWEDKQRQMKDAYVNISSAINYPAGPHPFLMEPFLFYLYSRLNDKDMIKKQYFAAGECSRKYKDTHIGVVGCKV